MNPALRLALAVLLPAAATFACGSDENTGNKNEDGGPSGSGGKGGSAASAGGASAGGALGTGGVAPINCDTKPCENAVTGPLGSFVTPCCVSATQCGTGVATFCVPIPDGGFNFQFPDAGSEVIVRDPACKDTTLPIVGPVSGCCTAAGVCGSTLIPGRCTALGNFPGGPDAGPPISCHYPVDAGTPTGTTGGDAGETDASSPDEPDASGDAG